MRDIGILKNCPIEEPIVEPITIIGPSLPSGTPVAMESAEVIILKIESLGGIIPLFFFSVLSKNPKPAPPLSLQIYLIMKPLMKTPASGRTNLYQSGSSLNLSTAAIVGAPMKSLERASISQLKHKNAQPANIPISTAAKMRNVPSLSFAFSRKFLNA